MLEIDSDELTEEELHELAESQGVDMFEIRDRDFDDSDLDLQALMEDMSGLDGATVEEVADALGVDIHDLYVDQFAEDVDIDPQGDPEQNDWAALSDEDMAEIYLAEYGEPMRSEDEWNDHYIDELIADGVDAGSAEEFVMSDSEHIKEALDLIRGGMSWQDAIEQVEAGAAL